MQYRAHRYRSQVAIGLSGPSGAQQCRVIDVSIGGARLLGAEGLRRGDKVSFRLSNYDLKAVVTWSKSEMTGIAFRPPLTSNQLARLRYPGEAMIKPHLHTAVALSPRAM